MPELPWLLQIEIEYKKKLKQIKQNPMHSLHSCLSNEKTKLYYIFSKKLNYTIGSQKLGFKLLYNDGYK